MLERTPPLPQTEADLKPAPISVVSGKVIAHKIGVMRPRNRAVFAAGVGAGVVLFKPTVAALARSFSVDAGAIARELEGQPSADEITLGLLLHHLANASDRVRRAFVREVEPVLLEIMTRPSAE